MPPPWMRPATSGRRSPAMQRVDLRRRIVAALVVLVPLILIVYLLTSGGAGGKKVGTGTTTTSGVHRTTTTVAMQLVASVETWHLPVALSRSVVLPVNTDLGVFGGLTAIGTSGKI